MKHILALPIWGQICTISEQQPLTFLTFQTERLVMMGRTARTPFHRRPNTNILLEHSLFIGPAFIIPRLHFNNRNRFSTETVPYFVISFFQSFITRFLVVLQLVREQFGGLVNFHYKLGWEVAKRIPLNSHFQKGRDSLPFLSFTNSDG